MKQSKLKKSNYGIISEAFYQRNKFIHRQENPPPRDNVYFNGYAQRILFNSEIPFTPFFTLNLGFSNELSMFFEFLEGNIRSIGTHSKEEYLGFYSPDFVNMMKKIHKERLFNALFMVSKLSTANLMRCCGTNKEYIKGHLKKDLEEYLCKNNFNGIIDCTIKKEVKRVADIPELIKTSVKNSVKISKIPVITDLYFFSSYNHSENRYIDNFCLCVKDSRVLEVKEALFYNEKFSPDCFVLIRRDTGNKSLDKILDSEEEVFSKIGVEIIKNKESLFLREGTRKKSLSFAEKFKVEKEVCVSLLNAQQPRKTLFFD